MSAYTEVTPSEYARGLIRRALDTGTPPDIGKISRLSDMDDEKVAELYAEVLATHTRDVPNAPPPKVAAPKPKPKQQQAPPPPLIGGGEYETALAEVLAALDLLLAVETDAGYQLGLAKARAAVRHIYDQLAA